MRKFYSAEAQLQKDLENERLGREMLKVYEDGIKSVEGSGRIYKARKVGRR